MRQVLKDQEENFKARLATEVAACEDKYEKRLQIVTRPQRKSAGSKGGGGGRRAEAAAAAAEAAAEAELEALAAAVEATAEARDEAVFKLGVAEKEVQRLQ